MICAKEYITTGFSMEDANKLQDAIQNSLLDEKITIDFNNLGNKKQKGRKFFSQIVF